MGDRPARSRVPRVITELLAAGADARDAHQNVATGSERREDLLVASGRLRDGVESAARAAAAVLEGAGHPASDETDRRIRATLQAAATGDVAQRVALWKGTLDRDLDATGFGAPEEPGRRSRRARGRSWRRCAGRLHRRLSRRVRVERPPARISLRDDQAERDAAGLRAVAKRARAAADAKRGQADRLAEEAHGAAKEASAAEHAADAAEDAASRAERRWILDPRPADILNQRRVRVRRCRQVIPGSAAAEGRRQHVRSGAISGRRNRVAGTARARSTDSSRARVHQFLDVRR